MNYLVFFFLLHFSILAPSAFAEATNPAQAVLQITQEADRLFEEGDVQNAIQELSRALILAPDHEPTQRRLIALGDNEYLPAPIRIQLLQLGDLIRVTNQTKANVRFWEQKVGATYQQLVGTGVPISQVDLQLEQIASGQPDLQSQQAVFDEAYARKDLLAAVIADEYLRKWEWEADLNVLQRQFTYLKKAYQEQAMPGPTLNTNLKSYARFDRERTPVQQSIREEIARLKAEVDRLKENMMNKEGGLSSLQSQIIDYALELSEMKFALAERNDAVMRLESELLDSQSRIKLGQRIVMEKEDFIRNLREEIAQIKKLASTREEELKNMFELSEQELNYLNGFLLIYQSKLSDLSGVYKIKQSDVVKLEGELSSTRSLVTEKELALSQARQEVYDLKQQLTRMKERMSILENSFKIQSDKPQSFMPLTYPVPPSTISPQTVREVFDWTYTHP